MRIFLTHILPEDYINKYKLSFAACNFSRNLISGNGFDLVYSTMPTFVTGDLQVTDPSCTIIYSSKRNRGHFLGKLSTFFEQWTIFKALPRQAEIWLYNISVLNAFLYILIRLFKPNCRIYVIELDFTPPVRKFSKMGLFLWMMNHSDGLIKLADSDLFTNPNSVCLPGVTPNDGNYPLITKPNLEFLLSGVLQPDISSMPLILEAFSKVPKCKLHITGELYDKEQMNDYVSRCSNIIYHGVLSHKSYFELLHSVTFQLSLRNPLWGDNSCNFPSKIIEALLHNRAVITTIHYPQLGEIPCIEVGRNVGSFVKMLKDIAEGGAEYANRYINQSEITQTKYSVDVWNESMNKLETLSVL